MEKFQQQKMREASVLIEPWLSEKQTKEGGRVSVGEKIPLSYLWRSSQIRYPAKMAGYRGSGFLVYLEAFLRKKY